MEKGIKKELNEGEDIEKEEITNVEQFLDGCIYAIYRSGYVMHHVFKLNPQDKSGKDAVFTKEQLTHPFTLFFLRNGIKKDKVFIFNELDGESSYALYKDNHYLYVGEIEQGQFVKNMQVYDLDFYAVEPPTSVSLIKEKMQMILFKLNCIALAEDLLKSLEEEYQ